MYKRLKELYPNLHSKIVILILFLERILTQEQAYLHSKIVILIRNYYLSLSLDKNIYILR